MPNKGTCSRARGQGDRHWEMSSWSSLGGLKSGSRMCHKPAGSNGRAGQTLYCRVESPGEAHRIWWVLRDPSHLMQTALDKLVRLCLKMEMERGEA